MHARVFTYRPVFRLLVLVFLILALVPISVGCNYPRDPRGTLEAVRNGTMRVGIVDNDPWTRTEGGSASGVEVELLEDFAEKLGAETSFVPGTLERARDLDWRIHDLALTPVRELPETDERGAKEPMG